MRRPRPGERIEQIDPASREARDCVAAYVAELARRFERGFDPRASLPADEADFRPPNGAFLVARIDGRPVACGGVKVTAPGVGSVKRMWVAGDARGLGLGRRMLVAVEGAARWLGCTRLQLETNRALTEAIRLYRDAGYAEVAPFNDERYADHWFEKHLA
jgi:GNAT superfamily N-acetyltransferase